MHQAHLGEQEVDEPHGGMLSTMQRAFDTAIKKEKILSICTCLYGIYTAKTTTWRLVNIVLESYSHQNRKNLEYLHAYMVAQERQTERKYGNLSR
jgi:hypothetical protein